MLVFALVLCLLGGVERHASPPGKLGSSGVSSLFSPWRANSGTAIAASQCCWSLVRLETPAGCASSLGQPSRYMLALEILHFVLHTARPRSRPRLWLDTMLPGVVWPRLSAARACIRRSTWSAEYRDGVDDYERTSRYWRRGWRDSARLAAPNELEWIAGDSRSSRARPPCFSSAGESKAPAARVRNAPHFLRSSRFVSSPTRLYGATPESAVGLVVRLHGIRSTWYPAKAESNGAPAI